MGNRGRQFRVHARKEPRRLRVRERLRFQAIVLRNVRGLDRVPEIRVAAAEKEPVSLKIAGSSLDRPALGRGLRGILARERAGKIFFEEFRFGVERKRRIVALAIRSEWPVRIETEIEIFLKVIR